MFIFTLLQDCLRKKKRFERLKEKYSTFSLLKYSWQNTVTKLNVFQFFSKLEDKTEMSGFASMW